VGTSRRDMADERAERVARRAQQATMQANPPPVEEDARPSTPPPLFTQPPSPPAAFGGIHRSDDEDDDDDSGDEEASARMQSRVPGEKTTGEMEDDQPEEQNYEDDVEGTIKRLDVKSKSKMSDADLRDYFSSKLQKKAASCCPERLATWRKS